MLDRKYCQGCRNDYYNKADSDCWSRKDAKMIQVIAIGFWEKPPYLNKRKIMKPSCYHEDGNNRTIYITADKITPAGYWRTS